MVNPHIQQLNNHDLVNYIKISTIIRLSKNN